MSLIKPGYLWDGVFSVAFSPDGKTLASGCDDKTVRLWDLATGTEITTFKGHIKGVTSVAFSPSSKMLASGSEDLAIKLWDIATGAEIRTLERHAGFSRIFSIAFSPDGRTLVSKDWQTVKLWDVATGVELASIVSFDDGGWVIVTPDGRFDTNRIDDIKGLHWLMPDSPLAPVPIEIFMRDYYEPKLLPRALARQGFGHVRDFSMLNRTQPEVKIVSIVPNSAETVNVAMELGSVKSATQKDTEGKLLESGVHDLRLFRDGQLVGYAPEQDGPIKLESGKATITFKDIKLPRRADLKQVEFSAYAFNVDRVKSETARQTYALPRPLPTVKGRAYAIAVGVNAYENAALDLSFAANDARRLQGVLTEKLKAAGEYEEVVPITLLSDYEITNDGRRRVTEQQATKGNVKLVLDLLAGRPVDPARRAGIANADKLRQARPEDLVILSFASHGYADEAGRFYFVTYDTGTGTEREITPEVLQKSISSDELSRWLRDVDAGELVMIVDACQSAAAVEGEGFKPGPMGSRGLGQLAYDKGMRILAATQADNAALEHGLIRQGLLTYALVRDGIELGRADFKPADKTVTLGEWLEYARDRVPQLFAEVRSGQVRGSRPGDMVDAPKVILLPRKNAQPNQTGATRLFLQGKPVSASGKLTLAEEQIQQPALFDYARKRRDVLLLRK